MEILIFLLGVALGMVLTLLNIKKVDIKKNKTITTTYKIDENNNIKEVRIVEKIN